MNRPLASVAVAYIAGICLAWCFPLPLAPLFALTFAVLAIGFIWRAQRAYLLWPLLFLFGWLNLDLRTAVVAPNDLRLEPGNRTAIVTLRGTLAGTPHLKITEVRDQEKWRTIAIVHASEIQEADRTNFVTGDVVVTTPGVLDTVFFAGQPVRISGVIAPPPGPLAEGLFDYQQYLATKGIFHELRTSSTNDWQLLNSRQNAPPFTDRFLTWSKGTLALGLPIEDEPLRLLWAMTLGWRTAFTGDIADPFIRAGTFHMFAVDGLRIALLSFVIITFLSAVRLSRVWCGVIAVPAIWFYTAATGWEPSAIRASIMTTIVLAGWMLHRPANLLNSLAFAALIILVIDPRQLFEAGFQLSFFVVLVIALMMPRFNDLIHRHLQPDPFLAKPYVPWWQEKMYAVLRHIAQLAALSFAAWIGSLPLSALYFHLFSPVSTLANLFAVPLGTFALVANLGALICGHWLPWATALFNHAAWFLMVAMTWVSDVSTRMPGAYFYVPTPSFTFVLGYYAIIIALLAGVFNTLRRQLLLTALLVAVIGCGFYGWQINRHQTKLTILPLNGSHVIFAQSAKADYLIDCGNEKSAESVLVPFLHAQGMNHLSNLILTEGSVQTAGGAPHLDQFFRLQNIYTSGAKSRSNPYRQIIAALDDPPSLPNTQASHSRHQILQSGDTLGPWRMLHPVADTSTGTIDDNALVLLGHFNGAKLLLLSDLSLTGQGDLLGHTNLDLQADIVVAGLPSKGEPLSDALLEAIHPRLIIITDAPEPSTRRASAELQDRLGRSKVPVIYTRSAGAVSIVTDVKGWRVNTMDGQEFDFGMSK